MLSSGLPQFRSAGLCLQMQRSSHLHPQGRKMGPRQKHLCGTSGSHGAEALSLHNYSCHTDALASLQAPPTTKCEPERRRTQRQLSAHFGDAVLDFESRASSAEGHSSWHSGFCKPVLSRATGAPHGVTCWDKLPWQVGEAMHIPS